MKKFLSLALFLMLTCNAYAQTPSNVLFKVSNITPIKNEDGKTTSCKYKLTVYNRTAFDLSGASLNLTWEDEAIKKTIEDEKNASKTQSTIFSRNTSKTQSYTSAQIATNIALPPIPAKKQIVKEEDISTSRCFLLLETPKHKINSCTFAPTANSQDKTSSKKVSAVNNCKESFYFVATTDPNYHTEFSDNNYDALAKKDEDLRKKEAQELNNIYNQNKDSIKKLTNTINSM